MKTNLFVIANVKQLRTGGSFRILLPFFRTSWGVGVLNSAIVNSSHSRVEFGTTGAPLIGYKQDSRYKCEKCTAVFSVTQDSLFCK